MMVEITPIQEKAVRLVELKAPLNVILESSRELLAMVLAEEELCRSKLLYGEVRG